MECYVETLLDVLFEVGKSLPAYERDHEGLMQCGRRGEPYGGRVQAAAEAT